MVIDKQLLDNLTEQAKVNPRLRQAYDLRTSTQDSSQRILNACEPGTILPIHRHRGSSETIVCLRGKCVQHLYEEVETLDKFGTHVEKGKREVKEVAAITLEPNTDVMGMSVEVGQWHRLESLVSGTVILECKDGAYEPLTEEDILKQ